MNLQRFLHRTLALPIVLIAFAVPACEQPQPANDEPIGAAQQASVGGCSCHSSGGCSSVSYSDIPSNHSYYVTTFGGGADTQGMSCGGTADGKWAYIADKARFGCGAKVKISAKGKSCIAKVADCGPNKCVEEAASSSGCSGHHPIIDASPFITRYLFGKGGVGWSDHLSVTAELVDKDTPIGCPGGEEPAPKLDAKFVGQGSDAAKDSTGAAYYQACPGEEVHFWFKLRNTGSAAWVDLGSSGNSAGENVRLGVPGDKPDPLTGLTRISINKNANNNVTSGGGDCSDKAKCRRTVFSKSPGIVGTIPSKPGVYKTVWRLVDEGREWFGPTMYLTYRVLDAADPSCSPSIDAGKSTDARAQTEGEAVEAYAKTETDELHVRKYDSGNVEVEWSDPGEVGASCSVRASRTAPSWPTWMAAIAVGLVLVRRTPGHPASR
jgi:MYXO-CTERM domain-containing protein